MSHTFSGTTLKSVKKNTGKKKINVALGTEGKPNISAKSPFRTKKMSKRYRSK